MTLDLLTEETYCFTNIPIKSLGIP